MVACRSPKPKMGVRLTPCLFGNVRESMGQRFNLQICEDTGRKRALPEILSIGVNGCTLEFDSSGAGSNPASAVFIYLPSCRRNGNAPALNTGVRKGMGVRIPQTAFCGVLAEQVNCTGLLIQRRVSRHKGSNPLHSVFLMTSPSGLRPQTATLLS